ncbi:hypothetical protein BDV95DRAFT_612295 [Massariosphaeria phaeospora]|uniref:Uncharacterized protein n=1 Tax=Massariosphaeria phaeospora TaxID=100035 RepID=A0A7C8I1Q3_9PLEO|nr:hypothetical protein BDV95DRAFT_612295 [Massariosphaeria phaeospora]
MHPPTLLTLLASALTVHAGCFSSTGTWDSSDIVSFSGKGVRSEESDKETARNFAAIACDTLVAGDFSQEAKTKSYCATKKEGLKYDFSVTWTGEGEGFLDDETCKSRLNDEINACTAGGSRERDGFVFV